MSDGNRYHDHHRRSSRKAMRCTDEEHGVSVVVIFALRMRVKMYVGDAVVGVFVDVLTLNHTAKNPDANGNEEQTHEHFCNRFNHRWDDETKGQGEESEENERRSVSESPHKSEPRCGEGVARFTGKRGDSNDVVGVKGVDATECEAGDDGQEEVHSVLSCLFEFLFQHGKSLAYGQ